MPPNPPHPHTVPPARCLYSADAVRALDAAAIASGIAGLELMNRAGLAAFNYLQAHWSQCSPIEIFCGGGNNGGDGYVIAALAAEAGLAVKVWSLSGALGGDAALARQQAERAAVPIEAWQGQGVTPGAVVVDCLLGTGLRGAPREQQARAIAAINASGAPVLAVDIPSGLCSDTGVALGEVVHAAATVTFIGLKRGLFTADGVDCVGELQFCDLAVPGAIYRQQTPAAVLLGDSALAAALPPRRASAHKGDCGHVLVVGGDYGMAGAALLAASAAARCGAGKVSCASRPEHVLAFAAARPEIMCHGMAEPQGVDALLPSADVLALGPGLGQSVWARDLLQRAAAIDKPSVLDADALNLLAQSTQGCLPATAPRIITPHPGEAARLLGCGTAEVQRDRFAAARALQQRYDAVVLLKGAGSIIDDGEQVYVCRAGNPGMASGGMGDVLTGVIAALLAQGLDASTACRVGAQLHGMAADVAAQKGQRGLLAGDVIDALRPLVNP